jgi:Flp pilus assembly protein TadD
MPMKLLPLMARLTAVLLWIFSFIGCSGERKDDPKHRILSAEDQNRIYTEACDIIKPYMKLHGVQSRPADTAEARQQLRRAISLLQQVVEIRPDNWAAYWIMGKGYQALDDSDNACDAFGKSFALQKENPDVAREYMLECLNLGRGAEGVQAAEHAMSLKPEDAGLAANLALAYLIAGRNDDALRLVNQSLRAAPDDTITQGLKTVIVEVQDKKRPQPRTTRDLQSNQQEHTR